MKTVRKSDILIEIDIEQLQDHPNIFCKISDFCFSSWYVSKVIEFKEWKFWVENIPIGQYHYCCSRECFEV